MLVRERGHAIAGELLELPGGMRIRHHALASVFDGQNRVALRSADNDQPVRQPPVCEVPTIPGLLPSLFKESIDKGMRSGIPKESWKDVITVYGSDGGSIAQWTGTEVPRNCRVVLLDENGVVQWSHDKGYGLPPLKSLLDVLKKKETKPVE